MKYKHTITLDQFFKLSSEELYNLERKEWGNGGCASYNVEVDGDNSFVCLIPPSYKNKELWGRDGRLSINLKLFDTFESLLSVCRGILEGYEYCYECGKKLSKDDCAHQYFAGIYCDDCWTKEMESERDWYYDHLD